MIHNEALLRHFADLRDGDHHGAHTRAEKEQVFEHTVTLLDPVARQALQELNEDLLLGTGAIAATGFTRSPEGVAALWTLSWPEQVQVGVSPVTIRAHYGSGFFHPHMSGATVGEWPLNVFTAEQAEAELPTMRSIVASDLHNLVFQADYRIVPATTRG